MKRLQRDFVVEAKFPRKVAKDGSRSIWGDTDLKAIARQVEDLVPGVKIHSEEQVPGAPRILLAVEREVGAAGGTDIVGHQTSDPSVAAASIPASDSALELRVARGARQPRTTALPRKKRDRALAPSALSAPLPDTSLSYQYDEFGDISMEWIAALEAENKRLTSILAEFLATENSRIKAAIEQIDAEVLNSSTSGAA